MAVQPSAKTQDGYNPAIEDDWTNPPKFECERVCTTDKLLKALGGSAKEPTPNTCVTVCSTTALDACADACQRAVCANLHQVPAWNEACLKKCTEQCMKGREK